jgi:DNA-binding transcriptional LysR family regulator
MHLTPRLLMHSAVKAGLGVGLSRSLIAVDALAAREIAIPFGPALTLPVTYHFVAPTAIAKRQDVAAFRDWILAEATASHRRLERLLKRYIPKKSDARGA